MMWVINNIGTILVTLALIAVVTLIVVKLISDKKKGKSTCGCNCAHCAMAGQCHKANGTANIKVNGTAKI